MRWLIVGGGPLGRVHLEALHGIGEYDLTVLEPDDLQRKKCAQWTGKRAVRDWDAVTESPDFVVVASPLERRVDDMLRAGAAGAHFCVEPPIAPDMNQQGAVAQSLKKNKWGVVSTPLRFHPGWQAFTERLPAVGTRKGEGDAEVPDLYFVRAWAQVATSEPLFFAGAHILDAVRSVVGYAIGFRAGMQMVEDAEHLGHVAGQFQGGLVSVDITRGPPMVGIEALGPLGVQRMTSVPVRPDGTPELDGQAVGWATAYRRQAEHLRAVAREEQDPIQFLEQGYQLVELAHALYLSVENRQWLTRRDPNAAPPPPPEVV